MSFIQFKEELLWTAETSPFIDRVYHDNIVLKPNEWYTQEVDARVNYFELSSCADDCLSAEWVSIYENGKHYLKFRILEDYYSEQLYIKINKDLYSNTFICSDDDDCYTSVIHYRGKLTNCFCDEVETSANENEVLICVPEHVITDLDFENGLGEFDGSSFYLDYRNEQFGNSMNLAYSDVIVQYNGLIPNNEYIVTFNIQFNGLGGGDVNFEVLDSLSNQLQYVNIEETLAETNTDHSFTFIAPADGQITFDIDAINLDLETWIDNLKIYRPSFTATLIKDFDENGVEVVENRTFYLDGEEIANPMQWSEGVCGGYDQNIYENIRLRLAEVDCEDADEVEQYYEFTTGKTRSSRAIEKTFVTWELIGDKLVNNAFKKAYNSRYFYINKVRHSKVEPFNRGGRIESSNLTVTEFKTSPIEDEILLLDDNVTGTHSSCEIIPIRKGAYSSAYSNAYNNIQ